MKPHPAPTWSELIREAEHQARATKIDFNHALEDVLRRLSTADLERLTADAKAGLLVDDLLNSEFDDPIDVR